MSNILLNLVWPLDLPAPQKMVLVALADAARDPDDRNHPCQAWLPIVGEKGKEEKGLLRRTGLGKRTIQEAIKALASAKHIERVERPGHGVVYTIQPNGRDVRTGAPAAPVQETAPTGAGAAPNPLLTLKTPSKTSSSSEKRARKTKIAATRIAENWSPGPLPPNVEKLVNGWPPGRLDLVTDEFRDFWLSATERAEKADWNRAFHNRLRERAEHYQRLDNRNVVPRPINRLPAVRGDRPDPALDMWRQAQAELNAAGGGAEADLGAWPALPAE